MGGASSCEFRNVFCQLAVRAQRVFCPHKGKVEGQKTVAVGVSGGVGAKSIAEPCTLFSPSRRRDAFNHIKSSSNDVSPAATCPHAPRPQPHGSGTPRAAKCPLWETAASVGAPAHNCSARPRTLCFGVIAVRSFKSTHGAGVVGGGGGGVLLFCSCGGASSSTSPSC